MKTGIRLLSLVVALICLLSLASCSKKDYCIYMKTEDGKGVVGMTEGEFSFFLSQKKSYYLSLLMYNDETVKEDSPELWQRPATGEKYVGKTLGEQFFAEIINDAKLCVAGAFLLDYGCNYKMPSQITEYLDNAVLNNANEQYGSKKAFASYLSNYGTTYDEYRDLYVMTIKTDILSEVLFGAENGIYEIPKEELEKYFEDNYICVREIYVNTAYTSKVDGTKAPLDEEEVKKAQAVADEINERLALGEHFDDLIVEYEGREYVTTFPQKIYMSREGAATETAQTAVNMQVGEVKTANDSFGVHIMKREKTEKTDYEKDENMLADITAGVANDYLYDMLKNAAKDVELNEKRMEQFDISSALLTSLS